MRDSLHAEAGSQEAASQSHPQVRADPEKQILYSPSNIFCNLYIAAVYMHLVSLKIPLALHRVPHKTELTHPCTQMCQGKMMQSYTANSATRKHELFLLKSEK